MPVTVAKEDPLKFLLQAFLFFDLLFAFSHSTRGHRNVCLHVAQLGESTANHGGCPVSLVVPWLSAA